jgi:hypothetical protein
VSEKLQTILTHQLSSALKEQLKSGSEFWEGSQTLKELSEGDYFSNEDDSQGVNWPGTLKAMIAEGKEYFSL